MLNEKGMIPKDKGWGMSNLGLWGKNPCVTTLCVCHLSCLIQPLPTSLMFCWVVEQLWLLVVGTVIAEVVVAMEDCQSLSHMPTPPTTVRSSPQALFLCQIIFLMRLAFTTTAIFFMVGFLLT